MDSRSGKIVSGPDVISRGFVYVRESENLMEEIKHLLREELSKCEEKTHNRLGNTKTSSKRRIRKLYLQKNKERANVNTNNNGSLILKYKLQKILAVCIFFIVNKNDLQKCDKKIKNACKNVIKSCKNIAKTWKWY